MSAHSVNSPIHRLDFDVLSCIFKINADISYYRALETTLATCRVCHDWRNFMLSTSSIWAHLIDFGDRQWYTVEGRRELILRSGTAFLSIKVPSLHTSSLHAAKIILNVVGENLQRLQELDVTLACQYVDQWRLLYQPAPHLESFGITFTQEWTEFNQIFSSLFGGSAPMLRKLRFNGHRSNFAARPSWLNQLRSLELTVQLTVSEMLEVLMVTKNLVNLRLDQMLADHTNSTLPVVSLPKLAHLDFHPYGELTSSAVLLDHLCIPPACSLTFLARAINLGEMTKKSTFAPVIRAISSHAQSHIAYHAPQQLNLTIRVDQFILKTETHSDGPTFEFNVGVSWASVFPTRTLTLLLSEFALPGLSKVTLFDCEINSVNRPIPGFTVFMTSLPSVKAITTDKYSLRHLRAWSILKGADTGPQIGFPALKLLKLVSHPPVYWHQRFSRFDNVPDPVSAYVKARIARGHAISVIDFTEDALDVLPDMVFLRKAVGLKVHWRQCGVAKIREYICGTGSPQRVESV
ncbi:hypothetical protein HYPSUDRAFT_204611 [Hypholoma sublateritium FD-334 SS-4]|uniref:F-box domain-containing protein n=1 Tax=Hypholoma sublateritium (strain FD-334 SS-4) TaxID=945553 RepID=A0A0D2NKH3_HYPSF|nr:hypothetical protein HYPSUDRAFT_204611 [Hypholoma sublateritium FD-334 SS-4]